MPLRPHEREQWYEEEEGVEDREDDCSRHQVGHLGEEGELAGEHEQAATERRDRTPDDRAAHV